MTNDEFDRVVSMMADGLGLVVGAPVRVAIVGGGGVLEGTYERSIMLGDPVRILAVVLRMESSFACVPWERISVLGTDLPSDAVAQ